MKRSISQRAKEKAEDGARNIQSPPSRDRETGILGGDEQGADWAGSLRDKGQ